MTPESAKALDPGDVVEARALAFKRLQVVDVDVVHGDVFINVIDVTTPAQRKLRLRPYDIDFIGDGDPQ